MNKINRLSLNDALNYILNGKSDFEELDDETDTDLETEPENHISSDDSESITESNDADEPSANVAGQNVINIENDAESNDDESLARKITKDPISLTTSENIHNWSWRKNIGNININFKEPEVYPVPDPDKTPYEYFKYFITDEMLGAIAEQRNIYSLQSPIGSPISTTRKEIEIFLGVYFRMGLVKLPSQRSYWETFMTYSGVLSVSSIHLVNNLDINQGKKVTVCGSYCHR